MKRDRLDLLERYVTLVAARRAMGVVHLGDHDAVQRMGALESRIEAGWRLVEQGIEPAVYCPFCGGVFPVDSTHGTLGYAVRIGPP